MLPYPLPHLTERRTGLVSVADGDYDTRVRFIRRVGLWNLASLALPVGFVWVCLRRDSLALLSTVDPSLWFGVALVALFGLNLARNSPRPVQALLLMLLLGSAAPPIALWLGFMHDAFPLFVETAGKVFAGAWLGLVVYNIVCGRDYSFVGEFFIAVMFPTVVAVWLTIATELTFSEGLTLLMFAALGLCYWVYDLAMILRRRTTTQHFEAVIDLYRDVVNWIGYPLRVIRMMRQRKRGVLRW